MKDLPDIHNFSLIEVFQNLDSSQKGLTQAEAQARLDQVGLNKLKDKAPFSVIQLLVSQFKSLLVLLLLAAGGFSIVIGEELDAAAIFGIVLINALLGFLQEFKAEKSLAELKNAEKLMATVLREEKQQQLEASQLVPGDIVILSEGEKIPADIRLVEAILLEVDESMLTGESISVNKKIGKIEKKTALHNRSNMLFAGTVITKGRGKGVVTHTGMQTEIGKLATTIEGIDRSSTPLQKALDRLGKFLAIISLLVALPGIGIGFLVGRDPLEMLMIGVSLAVSVVPEGLPVVVTVALALGIKKMLKSKVLVRRLATTETLGSSDIICTDKTGTLTHNQMTVTKSFVCGDGFYSISGRGYEAKGVAKFLEAASKKFGLNQIPKNQNKLKAVFEAASLCNDAKINLGDPTERALIVAGKKIGIDKDELNQLWQRVSEIPFSSEEKFMAVLVEKDKNRKIIAKGAPEKIITALKLKKSQKERLLKINEEFAKEGLRVLAVGEKPSKQKEITKFADLKDLQFMGLIAMYDPPRKEVAEALATCRKAGIRVMMLTGDNLQTAQAIASELGFESKEALKGEDLDKLSGTEFKQAIKKTNIFARVSPHHKLKIAKALQSMGHQVAMTGDGVNDAAAIKKADVGIAVGSGTDLAKGVADMVLLDDNFASIVKAIREARRIFFNIKKFVTFLLAANFDEVLEVLSSIILHLPLSLMPIHILWINLATDSLPAIALASDVESSDVMKKKPYNPKKEIMHGVISFSIVAAIIQYLLAFGMFLITTLVWQWPIIHVRSLNLTLHVLFELLLLFAVRSEKAATSVGLFSNKFLAASVGLVFAAHLFILYNPLAQQLFKTTALGLFDWLLIIPLSLFSLLSLEFYKFCLRKECLKNFLKRG